MYICVPLFYQIRTFCLYLLYKLKSEKVVRLFLFHLYTLFQYYIWGDIGVDSLFGNIWLLVLSFFVRTWSKQPLKLFCSNFTDRPNMYCRYAYYILETVHWVFTELLPFDEIFTGHSRSEHRNKDIQFLGKELFGGIYNLKWYTSNL